MVKANELRIGNWVLIRNKIIKIEGIDDQGINSSVSGGYYPGETEIEYQGYFHGGSLWSNSPSIDPIPLTPEILERLGFKKSITGTCYGLITKDGKLRLSIFPDGRFKVDTEDIPIAVKYLHQLQNLYFALTGEELVYQPIKELT